ncbi:MAG: type II toxin-antitoxin system VapB family antitoxin [Terriglobales bacterium]
MRTTLDIPGDLLTQAQELLGFKSKTDTIVLALRELVRRQKIEELKDMFGTVPLDIDLAKSRRRRR